MNKILLVVLAALAMAGCEKVNAGYVGIKVQLTGDSDTRGVQKVPLVTGWVFYNPFTSDVFEYPTFMQNVSWEGQEALCFSSSEGMPICADVGLGYQLLADKVPSFYTSFRNDDVSAFTHGYLHTAARDAFNEAASSHSAEELVGAAKEAMLQDVRKRLEGKLSSIGVVVQQVGLLGAPKLPDQLRDAIQRKVTAAQITAQKTQEVLQVRQEAEKEVAKAEGEARARTAAAKAKAEAELTIARAESEARVVRAEADAKANQLIQKSLTAELIEMRRIDVQSKLAGQWKGEQPHTVIGDVKAGTLIQLPLTAVK